jgi:hypothetical protein
MGGARLIVVGCAHGGIIAPGGTWLHRAAG